MTASVREYAMRLASQAVGSGHVVRNHSWNTVGLNLDCQSGCRLAAHQRCLHWQDLFFESFDLHNVAFSLVLLQQPVQI